jgi:cobalamin biosynthesis Mg chelatase CobN
MADDRDPLSSPDPHGPPAAPQPVDSNAGQPAGSAQPTTDSGPATVSDADTDDAVEATAAAAAAGSTGCLMPFLPWIFTAIIVITLVVLYLVLGPN